MTGRDGLGGETAAVVLDAKVEVGALSGEGDEDFGGFRVAGDVGQGFLGDAKEVGFEFAMESLLEAGFVVDGDSGALGEFFGEPAEAGVEAKVV